MMGDNEGGEKRCCKEGEGKNCMELQEVFVWLEMDEDKVSENWSTVIIVFFMFTGS